VAGERRLLRRTRLPHAARAVAQQHHPQAHHDRDEQLRARAGEEGGAGVRGCVVVTARPCPCLASRMDPHAPRARGRLPAPRPQPSLTRYRMVFTLGHPLAACSSWRMV
jgi:hypothetical protein